MWPNLTNKIQVSLVEKSASFKFRPFVLNCPNSKFGFRPKHYLKHNFNIIIMVDTNENMDTFITHKTRDLKTSNNQFIILNVLLKYNLVTKIWKDVSCIDGIYISETLTRTICLYCNRAFVDT